MEEKDRGTDYQGQCPDNYRDFKIMNDYYDDIKEQLEDALGEDYDDFFYEDLGKEDLSEKE